MKSAEVQYEEVMAELARKLGLPPLRQSTDNIFTLEIDGWNVDCFINTRQCYLVCSMGWSVADIQRDSLLGLMQQSVVDLSQRREVLSVDEDGQLSCWRSVALAELTELQLEQYLSELMDSVEFYSQSLTPTQPQTLLRL